MNRKLLILLVSAMSFIIPIQAMAEDVKSEPQHPLTEQDVNAVTITSNESTVQVKNACQQVLEVYNLAGVKVASVKLDSDSKTITFNDLQKGCYILKVGKTVRKVYLK